MISFWYPTHNAEHYPRAPWMTSVLAAAFEKGLESGGLPIGAVDWQSPTNARLNAPVYRTEGMLPVVLFSPGFGMSRGTTTVLVEELTSRGYVVATIDHPGEAAAVEFPGGRLESGPDLATVGDMREFMQAIGQTALAARVADTRFVLDQLARLNTGDNPDAEHRDLPQNLTGALDLSRVGMFGHSAGGIATAEAMYEDDRIAAGINLDGPMGYSQEYPFMRTQVSEYGLDRPFLLFGAGAQLDEKGNVLAHTHHGTVDTSWAEFWAHQRGWKLDLTLNNAAHMSFTDFQVILPGIAEAAAFPPEVIAASVGTINPQRSLAVQRAYVTAFFDRFLRGVPDSLLDGVSAQHPEITVVTEEE
jgi:alpha-beta hydrolase superfamily lysophospholipase